MEEKLREFIRSDDFREAREELYRKIKDENGNQYESVIVESEEEIIEYSNKGYDCQKREGKWLMRKETV